MSSLWKPSKLVENKWKIVNPFPPYQKIYNDAQENLEMLSGLDELLSGMLSKSKGQILRVAAVLHVLFSLDYETPQDIPSEISETALKAAEDFVTVGLKHTAYMAGRGGLNDAIKQAGARVGVPLTADQQALENATISLIIPGKVLNLTALLNKRKFRNKGDKDGAVAGFKVLQKAKLGAVETVNPKRGSTSVYKFIKKEIPEASSDLEEFCENVMKFGVSLVEYKEAYQMPDITMESIETERLVRKRASEEALHGEGTKISKKNKKSPRRDLTKDLNAVG